MQHLSRIDSLVARLRRRLRWQLALRRLLVLGGVGLLVFGVVVLGVKARILSTEWTYLGGAVAAALAAGGLLSGLLRRLDAVHLAARLDETGGLHSRLGTALAFAREPQPTPFQQAAIEDALTVVDRASPRAAAPWQWAAFAVGAAVAALALAVTVPTVFAFDFAVARAAANGLPHLGPVPAAFARGAIALDHHDAEQLEALDEAVERAARAAADDDVKQFLDALNDLIRALKEGRISAEEAFAKLAALERARAAWGEQHAKDLEAVAQQLREAAEKQKRAQQDVEPLLEALRRQALEEAAKTLEQTADKLDKGALSERDKAAMKQDLSALAKSLESERQQQEREAKRDRDRLKQQEEREKDRFSKRDTDRLKDKERQLEQLRREQDEFSEARRQLERLQRELGGAAEDMLRRQEEGAGNSMSAKQMRQAAEMLRRMKEQAAGQQQMKVAAGRMGDLRELLRRAGQRQQGGQGQDGKDGPGSAMERFLARAGGQDGLDGQGKDGQGKDGQGKDGQGKDGQGKDGMLLGPGGKDGQGELTLLGPGQGPSSPLRMPGVGQGQDGGAPQEGEGIGEGHDSRLLGERTHMDVKTKDDFVAGQHGAGQDASRVVYAAASKGFASASYRDVHQDYRGVVEDALDRQKIPPGQRSYVRRYFDLIRPR